MFQLATRAQGPRGGQQSYRLELHERRDVSFSCRLTFVRTNAAFSASVLRPIARWVRLVPERKLRPSALACAAPPRALSAAVLPLRLCFLPPFPSSVFPRRYTLRPPTR